MGEGGVPCLVSLLQDADCAQKQQVQHAPLKDKVLDHKAGRGDAGLGAQRRIALAQPSVGQLPAMPHNTCAS